MVSPPFHRQKLATYGEWMVRIAEGIASKFEDGQARDVFQDTTQLALEVVARILFDADVNAEAAHVGRALTHAMDALAVRLSSPVLLPDWLPTPAMRQLRAATRELDAVVYGFIAQRRAADQAANPKDLLSLLLAARDETDGQGMTDEQVRDEAMTLFVAGFETTAITLAWALWLLARHPEAAEKLRIEVDTVLAGRAPTFEDLPRLSFTDGVVREALRLYPPAWALLREVTEDCEIGGYRVPKGWTLGASRMGHAPRPALLGAAGGIRSRSVGERPRQAPAPVCLFPLRGRSAHLHRQRLRHDGGGPRHRDLRVAPRFRARRGQESRSQAGLYVET